MKNKKKKSKFFLSIFFSFILVFNVLPNIDTKNIYASEVTNNIEPANMEKRADALIKVLSKIKIKENKFNGNSLYVAIYFCEQYDMINKFLNLNDWFYSAEQIYVTKIRGLVETTQKNETIEQKMERLSADYSLLPKIDDIKVEDRYFVNVYYEQFDEASKNDLINSYFSVEQQNTIKNLKEKIAKLSLEDPIALAEINDNDMVVVETSDPLKLPLYLKQIGIEDIQATSDNIEYSFISSKEMFTAFDKFETEGTISFTYNEDITMYRIKKGSQNEEVIKSGDDITFGIGSNNSLTDTVYIKNSQTGTIITSFSVNSKKLPKINDIVLIDYFPSYGQFVNSGAYGLNPERTIYGSGLISLGGYGGYLTYKFNSSIKNDSKNIGGMDFTIKGNAFAGNSEPGSVYVSKDNKTWYSLAGASHYEDGTKWDYELTYIKDENGASWTDNYGNSGVLSQNEYHNQPYWPTTTNYGKWRENGIISDQYTVSGVLLADRNNAWGYVDGNSSKGVTSNTPSLYKSAAGMDISWAVDAEGNPVYLDEINYVKVKNAVNKIDPPFGEVSPEIDSITRTDLAENQSDDVKQTPLAKSITINHQSFSFNESDINNNVITKTVYYNNESDAFDVEVVSPNNNDTTYSVFIGEPQGFTRTFESIPNKDKLRIVTVNEENEALIYMFNFVKTNDPIYSILFDKDEYNVILNKEIDLNIIFNGTKPSDFKIEYSSSNDDIAVVDENGRINALAIGKTTITANIVGTDISCTTTINVGNAATEIVVSNFNDEVKVNESFEVKTSVIPSDAIDSDITIKSENEEFAKVDKNKITALKAGKVNIIFKTSNGLSLIKELNITAKDKFNVVITIEKFTLGQGYFIEPAVIEVEEGDSVGKILLDLFEKNNIKYSSTGSLENNNLYLSSIDDADTGELDIPTEIKEMEGFSDGFTGVNKKFPNLGEFAYSSYSGWMYFANNEMASVGMSQYTLEKNDVVRLQFSIHGYGLDLGASYGGSDSLTLANKDELTTIIAYINQDKDKCLKNNSCKKIYNKAVDALTTHTISQNNISEIVSEIAIFNPVLSNSQRALLLNDLIASMPNSVDISNKDLVNKLNDAYEYLTDDQKSLIDKNMLEKLKKATKTISDLELPKTKKVIKGNCTYNYKINTNYKYDLTKSICKNNNKTTTSWYKIINKKNKIYKKEVYVNKIKTYKNIISYYNNGQIKVNSKYYKTVKNKGLKKTKLTYKSNGNKSKYIIFKYSNGKYSKRTEYQYNKSGQLKTNKKGKAYRYITTYKKGKAKQTIRRQYNSKGKLSKKEVIVKLRKSF